MFGGGPEFANATWRRLSESCAESETSNDCADASQKYQEALLAVGIIPSMSRKGDCWDNAVAESFFSTLKRELVSKCYCLSMKAVRMAIHEYIEAFYNGRRKHSTNGNLSPVEYERRFKCQAAMAA